MKYKNLYLGKIIKLSLPNNRPLKMCLYANDISDYSK